MSVRCEDCTRPATHGLYWWRTGRTWGIRRQVRAPHWCREHASAMAVCANGDHACWRAWVQRATARTQGGGRMTPEAQPTREAPDAGEGANRAQGHPLPALVPHQAR